jgi:hypothetical protein
MPPTRIRPPRWCRTFSDRCVTLKPARHTLEVQREYCCSCEIYLAIVTSVQPQRTHIAIQAARLVRKSVRHLLSLAMRASGSRNAEPKHSMFSGRLAVQAIVGMRGPSNREQVPPLGNFAFLQAGEDISGQGT